MWSAGSRASFMDPSEPCHFIPAAGNGKCRRDAWKEDGVELGWLVAVDGRRWFAGVYPDTGTVRDVSFIQ
jgi:hypothetical protein